MIHINKTVTFHEISNFIVNWVIRDGLKRLEQRRNEIERFTAHAFWDAFGTQYIKQDEKQLFSIPQFYPNSKENREEKRENMIKKDNRVDIIKTLMRVSR